MSISPSLGGHTHGSSLLTVGHPVGHASSMRDASKKRSPRKVKTTVAHKMATMGETQVQQIKYVPEAFGHEENGWQTKVVDLKSRVAALFNCYTMSDVTFQVGVYSIPAHRFILASASPVFFEQLFDIQGKYGGRGGNGGGTQRSSILSEVAESWNPWVNQNASAHITIQISDVPHLAFFEFLEFLYTDNIHITLDNVDPLMLLAETYKVAGLTDKCLDFLRTEVVPAGVLRVMKILRVLMVKAVFFCWSSHIRQHKAQAQFRELSLAERRAKLAEIDDGSSVSSARHSSMPGGSRRASVASNSNFRDNRSRCSSARSSVASIGGGHGSGATSVVSGDDMFGDTLVDVIHGKKHIVPPAADFQPGGKLIIFSEEVMRACWKCIQEETGKVLASNSFWDQDAVMIRQMLRLEVCSVSEIVFFRAIAEWAKRQCKLNGVEVNAENAREVISGSVQGESILTLIRFPVMTPEELEWEVVPTGLLPYDDVQQLLYTMTNRTQSIGRYISEPRSNRTLCNGSEQRRYQHLQNGSHVSTPEEMGFAVNKAAKPVYVPAPGDPLDGMLARELLHLYLKRVIDDSTSNAAAASQDVASVTGRMLPPISPMASARSMGSSASRGAGGMSRQPSQMVMGQRVDEEEQDGVLLKGGGRVSRPDDFVRIVPGLYSFRDERLVEIWVERGEVMALDHGPSCRLDSLGGIAELKRLDVARARELLQFPPTPPVGRGVPLAAFLCRQ